MTRSYNGNQSIYNKKQTNINNNMKDGMSYRLGYFGIKWCMQQFTGTHF